MLRMRGYVPQRQMFPLSAWSMSASVGLGISLSSAAGRRPQKLRLPVPWFTGWGVAAPSAVRKGSRKVLRTSLR
jgi:hypothetical protein